MADRAAHNRTFWLIWALVCLLMPPWCIGQNHPSEFDVKAAYLLNFGKFMRVQGERSSAQHASFDICVLGSDAIAPALDGLTVGEQIAGLAVRMRRIREAGDGRSCDVEYLSASEGGRLEDDIAQLRGSDVLTVSDAPDFLQKGGMIQFVPVARHVRFSVNLDAVHRTHIALSSELLRVALSVSGKPQGEGQP